MKYAVLIKQVPNVSEMQFDPQTRRLRREGVRLEDRKSTRLNSSHSQISYAVFCLKKKSTRYRAALARDARLYGWVDECLCELSNVGWLASSARFLSSACFACLLSLHWQDDTYCV